MVEEVFEEWHDYLLTGFNILIRGNGSKVNLVEKFCKERLNEKDVLYIYGHKVGETIKHILQKLAENFNLRLELSGTSPIDDAVAINKALKKTSSERYLVIHNLDGNSLRDPSVLEILSVLLRDGNLRLVATLACKWGDIYWNPELKRLMRFVEYTKNTYEIDHEELFDLDPNSFGAKGKKSNVHTLESLDLIWNSLPENAKKIFIKMYEFIQFSEDHSIQFHELYGELKKQFLSSSEPILDKQLDEYRSHEMIKITEDKTISFTIDPVLLASFVDSKFEA